MGKWQMMPSPKRTTSPGLFRRALVFTVAQCLSDYLVSDARECLRYRVHNGPFNHKLPYFVCGMFWVRPLIAPSVEKSKFRTGLASYLVLITRSRRCKRPSFPIQPFINDFRGYTSGLNQA